MGFYDTHISPRIVSAACGLAITHRQRRKIVPKARGRVLEIGMGSGHNLRHYDPDKVEMLWGLEPGETMRRLASPKIDDVRFEVRFSTCPASRSRWMTTPSTRWSLPSRFARSPTPSRPSKACVAF